MKFTVKLNEGPVFEKYPELSNFDIFFLSLKPDQENLLDQFIKKRKFLGKSGQGVSQHIIDVNRQVRD